MRRILQKNQDSLFSIIPKEIVEDLKLKAGDKLDFQRDGDRIIVVPIAPSAKIVGLQAADTPRNGVPA